MSSGGDLEFDDRRSQSLGTVRRAAPGRKPAVTATSMRRLPRVSGDRAEQSFVAGDRRMKWVLAGASRLRGRRAPAG